MKTQKIETRRMLLFLPLLLIPLMAGAFYALGGGKGDALPVQPKAAGINLALPDAKFGTDTLTDKMSVYDHEQKTGTDTTASGIASVAERLGFDGLKEDPQAKAIEDRLALLNKEMQKPYSPAAGPDQEKPSVKPAAGMGKDVDKLELLMKNMQSGNGEDPEMKQLATMLQRIQEIQNPGLAKRNAQGDAVPTATPDSLFKAIPAVIDGDQKAVQGSVVKLKLLDSIIINGQLIPKGYNIYGLGTFSNQRLNLEIKNIRLGNSIVPVNLTVFDMRDPMVGINAPEAVLTDVVNNGVVDAAGGFSMPGFDLTSQLAGAGIDAAKSLLTKKVKRIKQPLKAGYPLLLRDNTIKQKVSH